MLREEGIAFDDGTTWRVGEHDFLMTTTTANAGKVMQHLEYYLDTVWPGLRVHLTSVVERFFEADNGSEEPDGLVIEEQVGEKTADQRSGQSEQQDTRRFGDHDVVVGVRAEQREVARIGKSGGHSYNVIAQLLGCRQDRAARLEKEAK
jgi:glycine cleavage system aminomethyltransferase T